MIEIDINGIECQVEEGQTLLEAIRFLGIEVPTLCYNEGLTPYGACRLCVVETVPSGRLVTSCTYKVHPGLSVRTHSEKVIKARKMLVELMLATCPGSKTVQDLASKLGVNNVRFRVDHEDCLLCGLCVRYCHEQMDGRAIGFMGRGGDRRITTAFGVRADECRLCGGCMYICPVCMARCMGWDAKESVCGGCQNLEPPCLDYFDDQMCYMDPCVACEQVSGRKPKESKK